ncbi:hypothetical protein SAMN02745947_05570 [Rhodococcus rhodochrous J3]|uniref:Uncharacterized protein n=1 Tax=Rhodococcus rhodochrous J3 TaxID=903528 RepID=A0ABY1MKT9_RHORH|nr:hypothetical protein [Rhodococcus rhodochrous]MBF4477184.1 hypothetical protein [Rhodococcus rhodochrous]SMG60121.1 hypothetical protein SAMN02745947_05570 [Rhodococcus rhodochrous J3]
MADVVAGAGEEFAGQVGVAGGVSVGVVAQGVDVGESGAVPVVSGKQVAAGDRIDEVVESGVDAAVGERKQGGCRFLRWPGRS